MRDSSEMKTAVLPAPVGKDTPMRDTPDLRASRQASRQDSWYGRRTSFTACVDAFLANTPLKDMRLRRCKADHGRCQSGMSKGVV